MDTTPLTLLERLRREPNDDDWQRFFELYRPFLRGEFLAHGVSPSDVDDLIQEVMLAWHGKVKEFEDDGTTNKFRNWLRVTARHRYLNHFRDNKRWHNRGQIDSYFSGIADPASEISKRWDREHDMKVLQAALERAREKFKDQACWPPFEMIFSKGMTAAETAAALGMRIGTVYVYQSRVLKYLSELVQGMIEDS